jgi:MGT family glycosyltransferase
MIPQDAPPATASVLLWTTPADGHVNPGLPIARALVARGHEVRWYTGSAHRSAIEATGAAFEPMHSATDPSDGGIAARFPERAELEGLAGMKFDLKHLFLDEVPDQVADVRRILAYHPADVVLSDIGALGAGFLAELGGPRWATFGITALTLPSRDTAPFGTARHPGRTARERARNRALTLMSERVLFRDVERHAQGIRSEMGLPRRRMQVLGAVSPLLYLQPATQEFEYPRRDLPEQVHFIGPLLPEPPAGWAPPAWWSDLRGGRPVVLVNQGTVATQLDDLVGPALRGLADEPVLVVATTGGGAPDALGPIPANARVEPFVPFGALLPHVDVVVTNGGFGGVQFALAHGVPLVVAGTTEEKPEIAARVAWSGAGVDLRTKAPSPEQVREAVRHVFAEPGYRAAARRIQAAYARHDAPEEAVDLIEQLVATGGPVRRADRWAGRAGSRAAATASIR